MSDVTKLPSTTPRPSAIVDIEWPHTGARTKGCEVWLYGSVARGTHTEGSDLDVLTVSQEPPPAALVADVTKELPQRQHLSTRHYTWDQFTGMAQYGSLYLLHLKLEGHRLHPAKGPSAVADILTTLPPYQLADRDLAGFTQALDDVEWSLHNEPVVEFELGVIATVIRHCSILACYLTGSPHFDCAESIPHAFNAVDMKEHADHAVSLYEFRLRNARGAPLTQTPSPALAHHWLSTTRTFVRKVKDL